MAELITLEGDMTVYKEVEVLPKDAEIVALHGDYYPEIFFEDGTTEGHIDFDSLIFKRPGNTLAGEPEELYGFFKFGGFKGFKGFKPPKIRMPKMRMPKIRMPKIRMPKFKAPKFKAPRMRMNLGKGFSGIGKGISSGLESIASAPGKMLETIGDTAGGLMNTATGLVGQTLDTAGNLVSTGLSMPMNMVGKLTDVAGNVIGSVADTAGNLVGKVADTAGGLFPDGGQSGEMQESDMGQEYTDHLDQPDYENNYPDEYDESYEQNQEGEEELPQESESEIDESSELPEFPEGDEELNGIFETLGTTAGTFISPGLGTTIGKSLGQVIDNRANKNKNFRQFNRNFNQPRKKKIKVTRKKDGTLKMRAGNPFADKDKKDEKKPEEKDNKFLYIGAAAVAMLFIFKGGKRR